MNYPARLYVHSILVCAGRFHFTMENVLQERKQQLSYPDMMLQKNMAIPICRFRHWPHTYFTEGQINAFMRQMDAGEKHACSHEWVALIPKEPAGNCDYWAPTSQEDKNLDSNQLCHKQPPFKTANVYNLNLTVRERSILRRSSKVA